MGGRAELGKNGKKKVLFGEKFREKKIYIFVSSNISPNFPESLHNIRVCHLLDFWVLSVSNMQVL